MASNNMSPLRNFLNSIKNSVYNISIDGIGNTDINASSLFNSFPNLYRAITLNDMNYVTNMYSMFENTKNLSQIPNYNFNTSNVTDMKYMFENCNSLTNIPNFNTSKVTNMYGMFIDCENLINIPNFDTSNVTNMAWMFSDCRNLTTISNFNTSKVTNMIHMFDGCFNLINIPVLNITNSINMNKMFSLCSNLSQTSVNNIVTSCSTASKVTNKNWTNIGFNVAADHRYNTWIRTAPDYMNAVNIGWQNIGDVIKPAYKRRIMVGDNLRNLWVYSDFPTGYWNELTSLEAWVSENIITSGNNAIIQLKDPTATDKECYWVNGNDMAKEGSEDVNFYGYDPDASFEFTTEKIQMKDEDLIVDFVAEGDNTAGKSYRHLYIEDENIRPLEVGDIIGPGTKFYFTFPDNLFEFIPNTYAPEIGEEILILQAQQTNNTENFYSIIIFINTYIHKNIDIKTIDKNNTIFSAIREKISNDSFYTVTNEYIAKVTEYNNFDFWSQYILVDTRTLYRNVKVGDNLRNRTFYFTFPDDMYTEISDGMALKCEDPYFTFNSSNFTVGGSLIAYCYPDWNDNSFICYAQDRTQDWSNLTQPHPYQYEEGKGLSANWDILYTAASKDMIVTDVYEDSIIYQNIFIREEELPLTIEEQALNLARLYYFNNTSGEGYIFSIATTRADDVFVIQVTKNAAVQMWLTVNTTLGVVLEGSSNPTNEDYALALAEKYYKENYGNDTVYYGVATQKSETEFIIQVTQNAAVLMFLNVNVSTGEVTER